MGKITQAQSKLNVRRRGWRDQSGNNGLLQQFQIETAEGKKNKSVGVKRRRSSWAEEENVRKQNLIKLGRQKEDMKNQVWLRASSLNNKLTGIQKQEKQVNKFYECLKHWNISCSFLDLLFSTGTLQAFKWLWINE